jgi:hypothetical protein
VLFIFQLPAISGRGALVMKRFSTSSYCDGVIGAIAIPDHTPRRRQQTFYLNTTAAVDKTSGLRRYPGLAASDRNTLAQKIAKPTNEIVKNAGITSQTDWLLGRKILSRAAHPELRGLGYRRHIPWTL